MRVDPDEKELLLESNPNAYFTTPHYASYPAVLVRFEHITDEELADGSRTRVLLCAPRRVVGEFLEKVGGTEHCANQPLVPAPVLGVV